MKKPYIYAGKGIYVSAVLKFIMTGTRYYLMATDRHSGSPPAWLTESMAEAL
ncbi:MAG: hypothetical protein VW103_05810 [Halieaceae bacterium]